MAEITEASKKWYSSKGYVYFIGAGQPVVAVKIGVTLQTGITQRLRSHQSSNHELLKILAVIPVESMIEAEKVEKSFHKKYAAHQRFKQGYAGHEWFSVTDDLINEISVIGTKPEDLGLTSYIGILNA